MQDEIFIKVFYESNAKFDPKHDTIGQAVDIDDKLRSSCFFKFLLPRSTLSSVLTARSLRKTFLVLHDTELVSSHFLTKLIIP
jgi:hypothetical protein